MSTYTNYGDENRQYASYNSRMNGVTSSTESNLQGFNKAQRADRLYFDENGLTVESNGMRILNENGETVLSADDEGNLTMKGNVEANSGNIGEWEIVARGIKCGFTNDFVFLGYDEDEVPVVRSQESFGVTPEGDSIGITELAGASLNFYQYEGNTLHGSASLSLNWNTNDMWLNRPLCLYDVPTTATSSNVVLSSMGIGTWRKFYVSSSLRKWKDNVKTIENASERVDNLRGVSFTSKCEGDDPKQVLYGLIAEEVEKACPELASYTNGELQGVQYDRVCALLIEDNKACHRRIEALEKRLEELERRLDK